MPQKILRIAIVGLRHLHPRLYMPHFLTSKVARVVSVVEEDDPQRESFSRDFSLQAFKSLTDLLSVDKADVAAIFLPHDQCPQAAIACINAGVHVMVEKPVATSSDDVERIGRAAAARGVHFTTGYCWRMHPVAQECKRIVEAGVLGRIVSCEGRCAAGRVDRYVKGNAEWMLQKKHSGGGPMYNLGVHWIDLFRWLLDEEPVETSGCLFKVNEEYDIEDNSFAHVRFTSGAILTLNVSYTVPESYPHGRDLFISIRGTKGCLSWAPAFEGERDVLEICSDHPLFSGSPVRRIQFELENTPGYGGCMGRQYVDDFLQSILENRPPQITARDAVMALRVVEAIYRSSATGRLEKVIPAQI